MSDLEDIQAEARYQDIEEQEQEKILREEQEEADSWISASE